MVYGALKTWGREPQKMYEQYFVWNTFKNIMKRFSKDLFLEDEAWIEDIASHAWKTDE